MEERKIKRSGMILDCARRYYSTETIKGLIDTLSGHESAFLQLHLTDNQNVGIECTFLGQTRDRAQLEADGSFKNPKTDRHFLSENQIRDILSYAGRRKVEIIPEIDTPAHMEGFFTLAEIQYGKDYADSLAFSRTNYPGELDISSGSAIRFVHALYDEYTDLFRESPCFHIGCDELFSGSSEDKTTYISAMSSYIRSKGKTVRMWNDLLTKHNITLLDKSIQVNYWSWDGETRDPVVAAERRAERASVPDLQTEGFNILICNAYYLYYVPSNRNFNAHDNDYMIRDLKENWSVKCWDSNKGIPLSDTDHIIGSAVSMWSEDSLQLPEEEIIAQFTRQYNAMDWVNNNA